MIEGERKEQIIQITRLLGQLSQAEIILESMEGIDGCISSSEIDDISSHISRKIDATHARLESL